MSLMSTAAWLRPCLCAGPYGYGHWCGCAVRGPAGCGDDGTDAIDFIFSEVLDLFHGIHFGRVENAVGARVADAVDVGQRDVRALVAGKINACDTSHAI